MVVVDGPLYVVNSGEGSKSWESLSSILDFLLKYQADQESVLVVVGGGALSDVGGLAASLFKRGIRWVSVPTTLLAMVDAAWGGKTAINFGGVKNSVGVYHWPSHWIYDFSSLYSLNERQRFDGWVEIFKHAIIGDAVLFQEVKAFWSSYDLTNKESSGLMPLPDQGLIDAALRVKIRIVQEDPYERDLRRLLNYGHTLAHALESSPVGFSHGQAVWLGMLFELNLAAQGICLHEGEVLPILEFLRLLAPFSGYADESTSIVLPPWNTVWDFMLQDKKIRYGQIAWSLPIKAGHGQTGIAIDTQIVKELYEIWLSNPLDHKVFIP